MKNIIPFLSMLVLTLGSCTFGGGDKTISLEKNNAPKYISQVLQSPVTGSGNIRVDMYLGYGCPSCDFFSFELVPLLEQYASEGRIRLTYKYPYMREQSSDNTIAASLLCAHSFGKFQEFKNRLLFSQDFRAGKIDNDEILLKLSEALSLPVGSFATCIKNDTSGPIMRANLRDLENMGIRTLPDLPIVIIGGKVVEKKYYQIKEGFQKYLADQLGPLSQEIRPILQREDGGI